MTLHEANAEPIDRLDTPALVRRAQERQRASREPRRLPDCVHLRPGECPHVPCASLPGGHRHVAGPEREPRLRQAHAGIQVHERVQLDRVAAPGTLDRPTHLGGHSDRLARVPLDDRPIDRRLVGLVHGSVSSGIEVCRP